MNNQNYRRPSSAKLMDYSSPYGGSSTVTIEEKPPQDAARSYDRDLESNTLFPCPPWQTVVASIQRYTPSSFSSLAAKFCVAMIPSFLQGRALGFAPKKPERLAPTAYLDGIRGLAAFFVFICHYTYNCFVITYGYGQGDDHENDYFLQLPIIRLIYSGPPMVCVFFVVSGYALSLKPLKQIRARQWDKLQGTMTSSLFRRGMRLFLPTSMSMLGVSILLWLGVYEWTRDFAENSELLWHIREPHPPRHETLYLQLVDWFWNVFRFIGVWSWDSYAGSTYLDVHLWTIPVEFRSSLCLFAVVMSLARVKSWIRVTLFGALAYFALRCDRWEPFLFLNGALIAELDLIAQARRGTNFVASRRHNIFWISLATFALYLMSQPDEWAEETPGWVWLCRHIPEWFSVKYRFWQCIGSVIFVYACTNCSLLQKPFETRFVQYLGKVSYATYLMHGPVIHTIGYMVEPRMWAITGYESYEAFVTGFVLSSLVVVPALFWAADLFWRVCDIPSVKFARWVENKCAAPSE